MPDFFRKPVFFRFFRIPLLVSGVWVCLLLQVFGAEIPVVSVPRNSSELHSLANAFNATSAVRKTPYQNALAAAEGNEYGQILLVTGNAPQVAKPSGPSSLSFREQPSQVAPRPLSSTPFQPEAQTTRPIRPIDQKPRRLNPNRIESVRYVGGFADLDIAEEQPIEELQPAPITETDSGELETVLEEPVGFSRHDPYLETQENPSDESDLLRQVFPERKEKSEGKLTLLPVGTQLMPVLSVLGSLCLVLGAFFLFVLFLKKVGPKNGGNLPREALENVGRYPLNPKLQLNLIRLGNRLILVAVTPDGGVETISEIESPDEVAQILAQCRKLDPNGSQAQFKSVLDEFAQEKSPGGFFGPNDSKRRNSTAPTLSSLLAGGLQEANLRGGGIYG
ncbi:MAG: flagellar biosynthetic protein FliO [Planctomycetaceae bacterium]|nr:flagellar biosynthetic protein FliO [Planctomycetaceae bacterium]